ncbi:MAG: hypothetical protein LW701_08945 [Fluviicola sp.]|jgi:hypothetical protein|nr:hypothetical protein [Fluviicola sp.]
MAKTKVIIDEYDSGKACKFYSCFLGNETQCEFDKFIDRVDSDGKNIELEKLVTILNDGILEKNGAIERYFRLEGKRSDRICALPVLASKLRLYCIRISDVILIIGNGGVKTTDTYQNDTHLNKCVETLQKIDYELKKLEQEGIILYRNKTILDFPVELFINT